jgi:type VI secretion system secreted protein Hcp
MASSLVFATPAIATQDLFLRLSGIEGSSTDERHRREIELESYSQSVQSGANFGYGSGAAGKAASCGDIVVSKQIDAASPGLIMSVLTGARIANGTITFRRAGREQQEYYTVQMTEVIVTSVEQSDVAATSAPVKEIIKMKARQFRFNYFPQKPDGSLGPVQTFGFDCVSNSRL